MQLLQTALMVHHIMRGRPIMADWRRDCGCRYAGRNQIVSWSSVDPATEVAASFVPIRCNGGGARPCLCHMHSVFVCVGPSMFTPTAACLCAGHKNCHGAITAARLGKWLTDVSVGRSGVWGQRIFNDASPPVHVCKTLTVDRRL